MNCLICRLLWSAHRTDNPGKKNFYSATFNVGIHYHCLPLILGYWMEEVNKGVQRMEGISKKISDRTFLQLVYLYIFIHSDGDNRRKREIHYAIDVRPYVPFHSDKEAENIIQIEQYNNTFRCCHCGVVYMKPPPTGVLFFRDSAQSRVFTMRHISEEKCRIALEDDRKKKIQFEEEMKKILEDERRDREEHRRQEEERRRKEQQNREEIRRKSSGPCRFFNTPRGCLKGDSCFYLHG